MKFRLSLVLVLGLLLAGFGGWGAFASQNPANFIPLVIGLSLITMSFWRSRQATVLLGHVIVTCGCFLITYGIYLLPYAKPNLAHIFGLPLFWGLFCLFGGICAIYHGFCRCMRCPTEK